MNREELNQDPSKMAAYNALWDYLYKDVPIQAVYDPEKTARREKMREENIFNLLTIAEQYAQSRTSEFQSEISRLTGENEKFQFSQGMNSKCLYDTECQRSLYKTIAEVLIKDLGEDIGALLDSCGLSGEVEIVDAPTGSKTNESYGIFKDVHIDQWSVGDSGDSYAGFIYAKVKDKWIKVPYEC